MQAEAAGRRHEDPPAGRAARAGPSRSAAFDAGISGKGRRRGTKGAKHAERRPRNDPRQPMYVEMARASSEAAEPAAVVRLAQQLRDNRDKQLESEVTALRERRRALEAELAQEQEATRQCELELALEQRRLRAPLARTHALGGGPSHAAESGASGATRDGGAARDTAQDEAQAEVDALRAKEELARAECTRLERLRRARAGSSDLDEQIAAARARLCAVMQAIDDVFAIA